MAEGNVSVSDLFPALSDGSEPSSSSSQATIDIAVLEKRMEALSDSKSSVHSLSLWCQANNKAAGSIIDTWLRVLKKSPIEKRLPMFYLANDLIQNAHKAHQTHILNLWALGIQKATPEVRSPTSVSTEIVRLFKIWEERSIYSKEVVEDLLILIYKSSGEDHQANSAEEDKNRGRAEKTETYRASQEQLDNFDPNDFVETIRRAYSLKSHLGVTYKSEPYVNMTPEALMSTIRSREQGLQMLNELASLTSELRHSETKLQNEVEERRKIVQKTETALVYYETLRAQSKVVNNAYHAFSDKVGATMDKVKEKLEVYDEMERNSVLSTSPPRLSPPPEIPNFVPYEVLQAANSKKNRIDDVSSSQGHSGDAQPPVSSLSSSMMDVNPFSWPPTNYVEPFGMGSVNSSQQYYIPQQQHQPTPTVFQEGQQLSGMFMSDISSIPLPPGPPSQHSIRPIMYSNLMNQTMDNSNNSNNNSSANPFDYTSGNMYSPPLSPPPEIPNFIPYDVLQAANSKKNRIDDVSSSQGHSGDAQPPVSSLSSSMMDVNPFSWPPTNYVEPFGMGSVNSSQQYYIPQQQHQPTPTVFQEGQQLSGMFMSDISSIPLPPGPPPQHSIRPIMSYNLMNQTMDNWNNSNSNSSANPFDYTSGNMYSPVLRNRGMSRPFQRMYFQSGSRRSVGYPRRTSIGGWGMRGRGAINRNANSNFTPRGNSFNRGRPN